MLLGPHGDMAEIVGPSSPSPDQHTKLSSAQAALPPVLPPPHAHGTFVKSPVQPPPRCRMPPMRGSVADATARINAEIASDAANVAAVDPYM